jgi:hypothetical protein
VATPGKHLDFIRWYEPSGRIDERQPDRFVTPPHQYGGRAATGRSMLVAPLHHRAQHPILVDLELIDPAQLEELLTEAWRLNAPAKLRKEYDAR